VGTLRLQVAVLEDGEMTYDDAKARLIAFARERGGVITAAEVEADPQLAADREMTSAAAHALAGSTNVFATSSDTSWFPYSELRFSDLR
jgi:hypothetical protein